MGRTGRKKQIGFEFEFKCSGGGGSVAVMLTTRGYTTGLARGEEERVLAGE